jgi:ComF family protein
LVAVRAACAYAGPVRQAIHRLKYQRERHLAEPLAILVEDCLAARPLAVDAVVPVPLDPGRQRARGYNQAALLATPLAQHLGRPLVVDALRRVRSTRPQVGLSARARRANVRGAFAAAAGAVAGARLLVVDDVMTTGATLQACAEALHGAGADAVWGAVVARDLPA